MFQSTGKLKHIKSKNEKNSSKEEKQEEKAGTVDQIKKKYGFSKSGVSYTTNVYPSSICIHIFLSVGNECK